MITIIVLVLSVVVFFTAVISPHVAGKIVSHTNKKSSKLKRTSNWFWDPLTWLADHSIEFTRKTIVKIARAGKNTRHKYDKEKD